MAPGRAPAREKNDLKAMEKLRARSITPYSRRKHCSSWKWACASEAQAPLRSALLRRAQKAFPADFWINHDLGIALGDCEPPQHEEAIRFLTVAVALRPDSPGVRYNLGNALAGAGRMDEAIGRLSPGHRPEAGLCHGSLQAWLCPRPAGPA